MNEIKRVRYNMINCIGCGESTSADLVAFNFSKIFAEAILSDIDSNTSRSYDPVSWKPLVYLDLRFYYTIRDLCQEMGYDMNLNHAEKLVLTVRDVIRKLEFLMDDTPFEEIQRQNKDSLLYNTLFKRISSKYSNAEDTMAEIETLIRNLSSAKREDIILEIPILIHLGKDDAGHEMPSGISYYIGDSVRELKERICPNCGMRMDEQAGYRNEFVIGLSGLSRVGKTAYIASLIHQLSKIERENTAIRLKKVQGASFHEFYDEIVAEYKKGNIIHKTEVENTEAIPIVYVSMSINNKDCNFIFVDMPGEIYSGSESEGLDFVSNRRAILKNADVVWCCIEPSMIREEYVNANVEKKEQDGKRQLASLVRTMSMIYEEKVPASIILTQCDLLGKDYSLFRPDVDVLGEYLIEDNVLDITKMDEYVAETRKYVDQMQTFRLSLEEVFEGFTMFGVSSYGYDVSQKILLSDRKISPSMIELPFLWTLAKLGLIDAKRTVETKNAFGANKTRLEKVENQKEFYI